MKKKSRLLSFVDRGPPSWDQDHWLGKENGNITSNHGGTNISSSGSGMISSSQLPQIAEDVVNQFAYNGLTEEVNAFLEFVKAHFPSVRNIEVPSTLSNGSKSTVSTLEMFEQDIYISICREMHKNMPCPDFMEEDDVYFADGGPKNSGNADSLLLGKYMAGLSRETRESPSASEVSGGDRMASESTLQLPVYDGFGPMDCDGIHLSSCGHAVHQGCLDRYISSLKER